MYEVGRYVAADCVRTLPTALPPKVESSKPGTGGMGESPIGSMYSYLIPGFGC